MRFLLRSRKRRLIKKHFKKTGNFPAKLWGKQDGLWFYEVPRWLTPYTPIRFEEHPGGWSTA